MTGIDQNLNTNLSTKALIIDFDDTLMATRLHRFEVLKSVIGGHFALPIDDNLISAHWGKPFPQMIASIAPAAPYDQFYRLYTAALLQSPSKALPGAMEVLQMFNPVVIVTSSSRQLVELDLGVADLLHYASDLFASEDCEFHKPDPRVLTGPLARLADSHPQADRTQQQIIYIGDSLADWHVANAHDIEFHAVLTGVHSESDFTQQGLARGHVHQNLLQLIDRFT